MPARLPLTLAALLLLATPALAEGIVVRDARAYAALAGATSAAGYLVIDNQGPADRLLGATSPAVRSLTLHESTESADGMIHMEAMAEGVALPQGGAVELAPGGLHLMMMGLAVPLAPGATIAVTLDFELGPDLTIELPVEIQAPPAG